MSVAQVLVGQLQFRDAVLVIQRDSGVIDHRLLEVVDADVIAEDLLGEFLAGHERRAGEADEGGVGQGVAHVERQQVVLAAVGLVGHDDDVGTLGQDRVLLAALDVEFLDQGEDVAVVFL